MKTFYAYARANGSCGIRNHVAVINVMDNNNLIAQHVAACVTGTVEICPCFERGEVGADLERHIATLSGLSTNLNVSAAAVVAIEPVTARRIADIIRDSGKEVVVCSCGGCGGAINTTCRTVRYAKEFVIKASEQEWVEVPVNELILGMEYGDSDSVSGLISNPTTGMVADKVVSGGGRVVLSGTTEWMDAEESLHTRAITPELGQRIVDAIKRCEDYIISIGVDIRGTNPAPDNIKGGLSTIEEKALGAMEKGDTKPIQDLITYNGKASHRGLTLLDASPGGVENTTSLISIGCQLITFSTGKGNPIGDPVTPTTRVTGSARTVDGYGNNADVDVSAVVIEGMELSEAGDLLYKCILEYCNGKLITVEVLGDTEVAITRLGYTV